jgi:lysophospholipase L1-like esterase
MEMNSSRQSIFERHPRITLLVFLGAIFLMMDLLAGFFFIPEQHNDFRSYHDYYHHGMLPNQRAVARWGNRFVPYFTNSLGMRDSEPREVSLRGTGRRLLFIGDSFTEGVGMTYDETFAGLVAGELGARGVEVLNAAVIGYSPRLYYLKTRYLLEVVGLHVDQVYVFIDMSDIHDELLYRQFQPREVARYREVLFALEKRLKKRSLVYHALFNLIHQDYNRKLQKIYSDLPWLTDIESEPVDIRAFFEKNRFLNDLWSRNEAYYRKLGVPGLALARSNMDKLLELCAEHGIPVTLSVHPWKHQILDRDLENRQVTYWQRFCEEEGVPFLNLFPPFIGAHQDPEAVVESYFISRDVHWNAAGHRLVAQEVLEAIRNAERDEAPLQ